jgi:hypothetical protein
MAHTPSLVVFGAAAHLVSVIVHTQNLFPKDAVYSLSHFAMHYSGETPDSSLDRGIEA